MKPTAYRPSRRLFSRAALGALTLCVPWAARAGYNIFLGEYTLERPDLQARIAERFPVSLRYAELFTVLLDNPRLGLDARANRATVTTDVRIDNPLFAPQRVRGLLAISSGLKYDAATRSLRLNQPTAERVELEGLSGDAAQQLQSLGAAVASEVLRDYALYTFRPEELKLGNQTLTPGAITVTDGGIKIKLD